MAKRRLWLTTVFIILLVAGSFVIYFVIQKERVYKHKLFGIGEPITFRHVQEENLDIVRSFETFNSWVSVGFESGFGQDLF